MFSSLAAAIAKSKNMPFDFAVVDEAQDISVAQLRFLAALGRRIVPMRFSSPAILGSAFSNSRSRGKPLALIFADARAPCASITAPHIKSARRRIGCSARR